MFKCNKCGKEFKSNQSLGSHKSWCLHEDREFHLASFNVKGKVFSKKHRANLSKANSGKNNPMYGKNSGKTYEEIYGKKKAKEIKNKMSNTRKGRIGPMTGKKHSKESKNKMSKSLSGENNPFYGKKHTKKVKSNLSKIRTGNPTVKKHSESTKNLMSTKAKERWKNPEYAEKVIKGVIKGIQVKPNKPEKLLNKFLQEIVPGDFAMNIKGEVMTLGGKIPDFINVNGKKQVIELFGDYWHGEKRTGKSNKQVEKERTNLFKKYGYNTLIVWEKELKDLKKLRSKILDFVGGDNE